MCDSVARFLARAFSQKLPILAILIVILLAPTARATSFWQCEDQKCGSNPWTCCCEQSGAPQNADCDLAKAHFEREQHVSEAGDCVLDCHCNVVVQDQNPDFSGAHFSFSLPIFTVVPIAFAPSFEAPFVAGASHPPISRGPPPKSPHFVSLRHRGPPVA